MAGHLRQVIESPLRAWVRDFVTFMTSEDVLFLKKEDDKRKPITFDEWPSLRFDYRQIYGFDDGIFVHGQLSDLIALEGSGGWTFVDGSLDSVSPVKKWHNYHCVRQTMTAPNDFRPWHGAL